MPLTRSVCIPAARGAGGDGDRGDIRAGGCVPALARGDVRQERPLLRLPAPRQVRTTACERLLSLSRIHVPSALRCRGVSSKPFQLQAAEIEKAKWGDFAEFLEQAPYPRDSPQWARIYGLCLPFTKAVAAGDGARSHGFEAESLPNGMGRAGSCYIYHTVAEAEAFELHADARELDEEVIRSFKQLSES